MFNPKFFTPNLPKRQMWPLPLLGCILDRKRRRETDALIREEEERRRRDRAAKKGKGFRKKTEARTKFMDQIYQCLKDQTFFTTEHFLKKRTSYIFRCVYCLLRFLFGDLHTTGQRKKRRVPKEEERGG